LGLANFIPTAQFPTPRRIGRQGCVCGTEDKERSQSNVTVQRAFSAMVARLLSAKSITYVCRSPFVDTGACHYSVSCGSSTTE
jgi:hypothetical protein